MQIESSLKKTPLYQNHCTLNARMVDFGGWLMPVQYDGILSEYEQCRKSCALFDISHMGEIMFKGDLVKDGLDRVVTCSLQDLKVGASRYGLMLNDEGGVVDDLIIFCISKKEFLLVVNAANIKKDFDYLKSHLVSPNAISDISNITAKLDLQGPLARDVLKEIVPGIENLKYFSFDTFNILGQESIISRTGYTGELGYEIFLDFDHAKDVWEKLLDDPRVGPAGLGARDILRTEMAYSLYGHEITDEISPLEAGLSRFIYLDKKFIGSDSISGQSKAGLKRKIIYFVSETRRSPRHGQMLYDENHAEIGIVTSGVFSPFMEKGIGIGLINVDIQLLSDKIFFGNEKSLAAADLVKKPFLKNGSLKK